jgi:hypothetical protein
MVHYHIRWSSKELLDWEPHPSRATAEGRAQQLVQSGETFTIEKGDDACPRCGGAFRLTPADTGAIKAGPGDELCASRGQPPSTGEGETPP